MEQKLELALKWILGIFKKYSIPYQISGGFGVHIYGGTRPVNDIDIDIPNDRFNDILADIKPYIVFGPAHYIDKKWDLDLITLNYNDQIIDVSGVNGAKIYNSDKKIWTPLPHNFKTSERKQVFGIEVSVMNPVDLMEYKKLLDGDHQKIDIAALKNYLLKTNMKQTNPTKSKRGLYRVVALVLLTLVAALSWAGLTRAGYIPNFLNINILCSEKPVVTNVKTVDYSNRNHSPAPMKPIIYLYPQNKQKVNVQLYFKGAITASYPNYSESKQGWSVTAFPDGKIINVDDDKEYSYLFWEGKSTEPTDWNFSTGFVVKGEDTAKFLQEILPKIGLLPKEYNEFIVYWYPILKDNPYNLIHFAGDQYTNMAPLTITPKPDSVLRVYMVSKPLDKKIQIEPQTFQLFERSGFTVVEWGGDKN